MLAMCGSGKNVVAEIITKNEVTSLNKLITAPFPTTLHHQANNTLVYISKVKL